VAKWRAIGKPGVSADCFLVVANGRNFVSAAERRLHLVEQSKSVGSGQSQLRFGREYNSGAEREHCEDAQKCRQSSSVRHANALVEIAAFTISTRD
jgi:hypothetical protein